MTNIFTHFLMRRNVSSALTKALVPPWWKCRAGYVVPSFNMKIKYDDQASLEGRNAIPEKY